MVAMEIAAFAWEHVGKSKVRDLVFGEDPGQIQNNGQRMLINILSDDYELEMALRDIAVLKEQVSVLSDAVVAVDKKVEWSLYAGALQHSIHDVMDRWEDFEAFCKDMAAGGFSAAERRAKMPDSLHNQCQGFDEIAGAMHEAIMGRDENGKTVRSVPFFRAYEAYHPKKVNFGNPRKYFDARLAVFQHYASYQIKAVSLSVAYYHAEAENERQKGNDYGARHNDSKALEVEADLTRALAEQYKMFLKDMPMMAKAAVAGRNSLSFTQSEIAIAPSPDRDVDDPMSEKKRLRPSLPFSDIATSDGDPYADYWSRYHWTFTYMGETDAGMDFYVTLDGDLMGASGGWNLSFSKQVPLPKGMTGPDNATDSFLRVGRQTYGAEPDFSGLPGYMSVAINNIMAANRMTTAEIQLEPFVVTLALMTPNSRDAQDYVTPLVPTRPQTFDNHYALRVSDQNASGHAGDTLHQRRNSKHGAPHAAIPRAPDTKLTEALPNANDWDGALYLPDQIDISPSPARRAFVYRWGVPLQMRGVVSRGIWTDKDYQVRYTVLTENCIEVCKTSVSVDCGPDGWNYPDGYLGPNGSHIDCACPVIAVALDNNWTTSVRLFRQMKGESEVVEVHDFQIMDGSGPDGELLIMDLGGVVLA
ncbi:hypothetical protein [uncultured Tateyamaria sp.]|uniref:hypothetical protein n=1 Tax=uncultured Tateyamaria sp. TaxID=455651 RepID=UPI00261B2921|nr:hypothetical protein [uncultured Tateyamaria sp.]